MSYLYVYPYTLDIYIYREREIERERDIYMWYTYMLTQVQTTPPNNSLCQMHCVIPTNTLVA